MSARTSLVLIAAAAGCATSAPRTVDTAPPPGPSAPAPAAASAPAPPHARAAAPAPVRGDRVAVVATGLEFVVEPASAQIFVDGQARGTVSELVAAGGVLRLAPGIYQVSLKAPGFAAWRAEVAVRESRERIEVTLAPKP